MKEVSRRDLVYLEPRRVPCDLDSIHYPRLYSEPPSTVRIPQFRVTTETCPTSTEATGGTRRTTLPGFPLTHSREGVQIREEGYKFGGVEEGVIVSVLGTQGGVWGRRKGPPTREAGVGR